MSCCRDQRENAAQLSIKLIQIPFQLSAIIWDVSPMKSCLIESGVSRLATSSSHLAPWLTGIPPYGFSSVPLWCHYCRSRLSVSQDRSALFPWTSERFLLRHHPVLFCFTFLFGHCGSVPLLLFCGEFFLSLLKNSKSNFLSMAACYGLSVEKKGCLVKGAAAWVVYVMLKPNGLWKG